MNTIQLKVDGMSCGSCVTSVTRALQEVPGVRNVEVDLPGGVAQVQTTDGAILKVQDLAAALAAAGYHARLVSPTDGSATAHSSFHREASGGCGSGATPKGCCCGH